MKFNFLEYGVPAYDSYLLSNPSDDSTFLWDPIAQGGQLLVSMAVDRRLTIDLDDSENPVFRPYGFDQPPVYRVVVGPSAGRLLWSSKFDFGDGGYGLRRLPEPGVGCYTTFTFMPLDDSADKLHLVNRYVSVEGTGLNEVILGNPGAWEGYLASAHAWPFIRTDRVSTGGTVWSMNAGGINPRWVGLSSNGGGSSEGVRTVGVTPSRWDSMGIISGHGEGFNFADTDGEGRVIAVATIENAVTRSVDSGGTWADTALTAPYIVKWIGSSFWLIGTEDNTTNAFHRSTNDGSSWGTATTWATLGITGTNKRIWRIAADRQAGHILAIYATGIAETTIPSGTILRSADRGTTWTKLTGLPFGRPYAVGYVPAHRTWFVLDDSAELWRSEDRGLTWTSVGILGFFTSNTKEVVISTVGPLLMVHFGNRLYGNEVSWATNRYGFITSTHLVDDEGDTNGDTDLANLVFGSNVIGFHVRDQQGSAEYGVLMGPPLHLGTGVEPASGIGMTIHPHAFGGDGKPHPTGT
jgi:hypothetical protein